MYSLLNGIPHTALPPVQFLLSFCTDASFLTMLMQVEFKFYCRMLQGFALILASSSFCFPSLQMYCLKDNKQVHPQYCYNRKMLNPVSHKLHPCLSSMNRSCMAGKPNLVSSQCSVRNYMYVVKIYEINANNMHAAILREINDPKRCLNILVDHQVQHSQL